MTEAREPGTRAIMRPATRGVKIAAYVVLALVAGLILAPAPKLPQPDMGQKSNP